MACSITLTGASLECGNVGGIKTLYIAPIEDVASIGVPVAGVIPTITMVSTKTFKKYSFRRGNANYVSNLSKDDKAGTVYVTTDTTVQLNKMTVALRNEMVQLTKGQFYVIVEDENSELWFIGYGSYNSATTGAGLSLFSNIEKAKLNTKRIKSERDTKEKELSDSLVMDYNNMLLAKDRLENLKENQKWSYEVFESNKRLFLTSKKQWLDLVNSSKELMDVSVSYRESKALYNILRYKIALETGLIDINNGEYNPSKNKTKVEG